MTTYRSYDTLLAVNTNANILLTARDEEILDALLKTPLTSKQMLHMSAGFKQPFTSDSRVRRRLAALAEAGLVSCYQYATTTYGATNCYKITRNGYRLRQGADTRLPAASFFRPPTLGNQEHTHALADFISALHKSAARNQLTVSGFYRENLLKLSIGEHALQPDCAFQLRFPDGKTFNYLVEVDCATEPLRATKNRDSLMQKVRFYDEYFRRIKKRFVVLFLFTKASARMANFIDLAHAAVDDRQRNLVYAALLPYAMKRSDLLSSPVFLDRRHHAVALLPNASPQESTVAVNQKPAEMLVDVPTIW